MAGDLIYEHIEDIDDCPENLIERLKHYFLTYKESAEELCIEKKRRMEITHIYNKQEAIEVIRLAEADYDEKYPGMRDFLRTSMQDQLSL
jgi:inorganic pyrophosphatase